MHADSHDIAWEFLALTKFWLDPMPRGPRWVLFCNQDPQCTRRAPDTEKLEVCIFNFPLFDEVAPLRS